MIFVVLGRDVRLAIHLLGRTFPFVDWINRSKKENLKSEPDWTCVDIESVDRTVHKKLPSRLILMLTRS
jgi:hypothetical protein